MIKSPLNDMGMGNLNPNLSKDKKDKEEKKKISKDKSKLNNALLREFKPLILWATITSVLVVGSVYYTNSVNTETKFNQFAQIPSLSEKESQATLLANQSGSMEATLTNERNKLQALQTDLQQQDKVKTPLSQGYFFISYLTYLTEKYEVNLDDLNVLANDGIAEVDLTANPDLAGNFDLLPVNVKLTSDFNKMQMLFSEMYTKRIILVKELEIVNNFDSTVTAEFKVFFTDLQMQQDSGHGTQLAPGQDSNQMTQPQIDPNTGMPVQDPNSSFDQGANLDPNSDGTIVDPNQQGQVDYNGMQVDPNQGQGQIDPITGQVTNPVGGGE